MNIQWFPCLHEAGSREVEWRTPIEPFPQYSAALSIVANKYSGQWTIPTIRSDGNTSHNAFSDKSEQHESVIEETDCASFPIALTREVVSIVHTRKAKHDAPLTLSTLIATISASYQKVLDEPGARDCRRLRAGFRVTWWQKARKNDIHTR
jgi:hypothetical protein